MTTAGLVSGMNTAFFGEGGAFLTGQTGPNANAILNNQIANNFANNVIKNMATNVVSTGVNSAISGNGLNSDSLANALTNAFITAGLAQGANSIGDGLADGTLNAFTHQLAHAMLGCAGGVATSGNSDGCAPGAVGAVVGELSARYAKDVLHWDDEKALAFAGVMSAASGVIVAQDGNDAGAVNLANTMGDNAARYNALLHATQEAAIKDLAKGNPKKAEAYEAAACFLMKCSAEFAVGSKEYAYYKALEIKGAGLKAEQEALLAYKNESLEYKPVGYSNFSLEKVSVKDLFKYTPEQARYDGILRGQAENSNRYVGPIADGINKVGSYLNFGAVNEGTMGNLIEGGSIIFGAMVWKGKPSALGGDGLPMGSKYNQMNQPKNPSYQPTRNQLTNINGRDYSGHAVDRMQDRGIPPSVVENTIKNGIASPNGAGATKYYDPINNTTIIVNSRGGVVTVSHGNIGK